MTRRRGPGSHRWQCDDAATWQLLVSSSRRALAGSHCSRVMRAGPAVSELPLARVRRQRQICTCGQLHRQLLHTLEGTALVIAGCAAAVRSFESCVTLLWRTHKKKESVCVTRAFD